MLSKHVKKGDFVRSGYYLVQFLCLGVYYLPNFSRIGYHVKAKILEPGKKILSVGSSPYKLSYLSRLLGHKWKFDGYCLEAWVKQPIKQTAKNDGLVRKTRKETGYIHKERD